MAFDAFNNPKTQFVFGAEWATGTGISASSKLAPIPVDILSGAVPVVQIIFDSSGLSYYKPKQLTDNANAQAPEITGLQGTVARLQIFNGATFDRVASVPDNADAQAAKVTGLIGTVAKLMGWNGATFDRLSSRNSQLQITNGGNPATNTAITVTNASQQFLAANLSRKYLFIQNNDALGNIYITFGVAATLLNGIKIGPGASYEAGYAPSNSVNIIGSIASNANIVIVEA